MLAMVIDEGQKKELEQQMKYSNPQAIMEEFMSGFKSTSGTKKEEAKK